MNRILLIFLVWSLLVMGSCMEQPEPLQLGEDKMVEVLVDFHLAEAALQNQRATVRDSLGAIYFQQVFQIHNVVDSVFYSDLELMSQNPVQTERVYARVIDELSKIDPENINTQKDLEQRKKLEGNAKNK